VRIPQRWSYVPIVSLCGSGLLILLLSTPAGAASISTTTSTTTAQASTAQLNNNQADLAAILALTFGLLAIVAILLFLFWDRSRSFKALQNAGETGSTTIDDQGALAGAAFVTRTTSGTVPIVGTTTLPVNTPTTYLVKPSEGTDSPQWSIQGDATLGSQTGSKTQVTAKGAGAIILSVLVGSDSGELEITATSAPKSSAIPFLGQGYGSVVIALSVASVTAALGLTNIINGQAVAGILGSLVTYSVVRGTSAASGGSSSKSGSASPQD
jgi:hypothetical protein